jgi:hypothetical protein
LANPAATELQYADYARRWIRVDADENAALSSDLYAHFGLHRNRK